MLSEKKDRMLARVSKLAKVYGPSVRFYPEGSEGNEPGDVNADSLDGAIKDGEAAARTPEEQKAIDDARKSEQKLEQEQANTRRANAAAREVQSELESVNSENKALQEQLAAAEAKAAEAGISDIELSEDNYTGADLALVDAIKTLNKKIAAKDKRTEILEKKVADYEGLLRKDEAAAARNSAYEELLSDLDAEYGADVRNAAVKKFNELAADGKVPKGSPAKATRVMERCYKEAKAAKDKAAKDKAKGKSPLSLDSGSGGGTAPNLSGVEVKAGSLDEVAEQYSKALATKKK